MARLKEFYYDTIVEAMMKKFGYKNAMEVPKLEKIVINMGIGEAKENAKVLENAVSDMEIISGRGNYALGIKEQFIFPEIEYDKIDKTRGMDVIFVTTARSDEEARELLTLFNMPFAKQ